jgi:peptidoglycan/xylan/chitin deacetylase (PgdA/CDA1 family)
MFIEQVPDFVRWFYQGVIWRKQPHEKALYLTFDDGPVPEVTPWVLDKLDELEVQATFFCVGDNVRKHPHLYREIVQRGHRTGNHTFNHVRGWSTNTEDYVFNVNQAAGYIESRLFRPPHGQLRHSQMRKLQQQQFQIVHWDVVSRDYNRRLPPEQVLGIVLSLVRNGSIIVFHDSRKAFENMSYAMPRAVETLKRAGYVFRTL